MIKTSIVKKLEKIYDGEDFTAIMPAHLKKSRKRSMLNQLPKFTKNKLKLRNHLTEASKILQKHYEEPSEEEEEEKIDDLF